MPGARGQTQYLTHVSRALNSIVAGLDCGRKSGGLCCRKLCAASQTVVMS